MPSMMLRPDQPGHPSRQAGKVDASRAQAASDDAGNPRLNLLLSSAQWRYEPAFEQLPHLLAPLGIRSITAGSGEEAAEVIRTIRVHIAVVDLAIPMQRPPNPGTCAADAARFALASAGPRVLQLLRRLDAPPPTVVVRPPPAAARESARSLLEALREGAFAVLDRPVPLEAMLEVMRRIVRRHYADAWPV
jgi:CheY-like chemotaxis protein